MRKLKKGTRVWFQNENGETQSGTLEGFDSSNPQICYISARPYNRTLNASELMDAKPKK